MTEGTGVIVSQPVNSHANIRSVSTLRLSSRYNGLRTSCRCEDKGRALADTVNALLRSTCDQKVPALRPRGHDRACDGTASRAA